MGHEPALRHRRRRAQARVRATPSARAAGRAPAAAHRSTSSSARSTCSREGSALRVRHRAGPPALDDPLRAARARARRRWRGSWPPRRHAAFEELSAVEAGRAGGAQGARARPAPPPARPSRRSSSSTRSTASTRPSRTRCCPRSRRASSRSSGRRPRTRTSRSTPRCSRAARSTSCSRCWPATSRSLLRRAVARRSSAEADDDAIAFLAARAGGDARTALAALELAVHDRDGRVTLAGGRGRAAAPRAALRQGRRPPLRHDLGLDQGHARLGPRRLRSTTSR